jgi:hypothetical protein
MIDNSIAGNCLKTSVTRNLSRILIMYVVNSIAHLAQTKLKVILAGTGTKDARGLRSTNATSTANRSFDKIQKYAVGIHVILCPQNIIIFFFFYIFVKTRSGIPVK